MIWTYQRRVKYYETDRMGVVHQSNYLRILEDARMDWIGEHVMNYHQMEVERKIIIPAVSATGHFVNFLRYDDLFEVAMELIQYTSVRIKFRYEVKNVETGELCYKGETEHCFVHDVTYKPLMLKREAPDLHALFLNAVTKD